MNEYLKICPKCNSVMIDVIRDESRMWHVKCFACGFMHIACLSRRQAMEMWNKITRKETDRCECIGYEDVSDGRY